MSGPTPLVPLTRVAPDLYAKIEYLHPSGSMKHRSIPAFVEEILWRGELAHGQTLAIRSAGAAAVTAAWAGVHHGIPVIAVVPLTVSEQVVNALVRLGAQVQRVTPDRAIALMGDYGGRPTWS